MLVDNDARYEYTRLTNKSAEKGRCSPLLKGISHHTITSNDTFINDY